MKLKDNFSPLSYSDNGKGNVVVLLHGYLESKEMWSGLASELSKNYRVICPDLPGHGKSMLEGEIMTMELAAKEVKNLLDTLSIEKCVLIGHSMGGYVALAFAELFPKRLCGFGLFHSHPNADSDEKKASRMLEIEMIASGKKAEIVETNIPRLFANSNLQRLSKEVTNWKKVAQTTPDSGIIASLRGMALRKDRNFVFSQLKVPNILIFGKCDNLIPNAIGIGLETKHSHLRIVWLENSGHLGMIEEPDQARLAITSFLLAVFSRA